MSNAAHSFNNPAGRELLAAIGKIRRMTSGDPKYHSGRKKKEYASPALEFLAKLSTHARRMPQIYEFDPGHADGVFARLSEEVVARSLPFSCLPGNDHSDRLAAQGKGVCSLREIERQRAVAEPPQGRLAEDPAEQQILRAVARYAEVGLPRLSVANELFGCITRGMVGVDGPAMGGEERCRLLQPAGGRRRIIAEMHDPHGRVRIETRMDEVLERLRTLKRTRVGHQHPPDGPVFLGHREDRPHTVRHEPLERVRRLRHDVVLEEAAQPEHTHVVIADQIGRDLERRVQ